MRGLHPAGKVDSRVNLRLATPEDGFDHGHRARSAPPDTGHRAGRHRPRAHLSQPAGRRRRREGRPHDRRGLPPARGRAARRARRAERLRGRPAGATMYVSLEPCCHEGRTPPCTEAIVEAGIARVVVASDDPSEKASGRGLGILRDEGIEVDVFDGEVAEAARLLNQPFRKHARTGRPARGLQVGDDARRQGRHPHAATRSGSRASPAAPGRTAGAPSATRWRWASTRPRTTTRCSPRASRACRRQPRRVVFDSEASLPLDSQLVRSAGEVPVILVCSRAAKRTATDALRQRGGGGDRDHGRERGGPRGRARSTSSGRATSSRCCSRAARTWRACSWRRARSTRRACSSRRCCSAAGSRRRAVEGQGVEWIADAVRAVHAEVERIDDDVLITARLREW